MDFPVQSQGAALPKLEVSKSSSFPAFSFLVGGGIVYISHTGVHGRRVGHS